MIYKNNNSINYKNIYHKIMFFFKNFYKYYFFYYMEI